MTRQDFLGVLRGATAESRALAPGDSVAQPSNTL